MSNRRLALRRASQRVGQNASAGGAEYLMQLYDRLDEEELKERAIFGIAQTDSEEGRRWLQRGSQ